MCETCGCNLTPGTVDHMRRTDAATEHTTINVFRDLRSANNEQAEHNRHHFDQHGILCLNLMSSPGSGKTALLEATIDALGKEFRIAVIEGDLETENDALRIRAKGVPAVQIATGTACHLDAHLVHDAVHQLDLSAIDILFIENVGNLVCPASFDLGHHRNVTLLSVTEGDDKPAKYPVMFRATNILLITKTDLLPLLDDFDPGKAEAHLRKLANHAPALEIAARRGTGLTDWLDWLRAELGSHRKRIARGETSLPAIQPDGLELHARNTPPRHRFVRIPDSQSR